MNQEHEKAPATAQRNLVVLRSMIDALDHELLQLWARRNALVAEIAQRKRETSVPIRDLGREREILEDRLAQGVGLGLPSELVESLFRLVLRGSRDRQAALKTELPIHVQQKKLAIIGGKGGMGQCMARLFGDLGHAVMIADLDTPLSPKDAVAAADVVVISVPIDETIRVVEQLGPHVRPDALLTDVTSIKQPVMDAMMACSRSAVVGTHPLFGPSVHSMQGQRVVMCRGRYDGWFDWLKDMFSARGMVIKEATAPKHDEAMALVQVLVHFSTEIMGRTLVALDADVDETLQFTSPVYLMELLMTARHFAQSSDLYASIQMENPQADMVTEAYVAAAHQMAEIIRSRNRDAMKTLFQDVRTLMGSFTEQALDQSSYLIDRLVERA